MYEFIQKFHSGWAYLALLLLVVAVVNSALGFTSKKEFTPRDRKIALFALIATHIQLVVGLVLYFVSVRGFKLFASAGVSEVMKTAELRLTAVEHPAINIIAIVFITIGWSKHKRILGSSPKFKSIAVFYGLGLLLILSRIPWSLWF